MSRPSRKTPKTDALFDEQALYWLKRKSLKEISQLTGFAPSHCWEQIHVRIERMRVTENVSVSRETDQATLEG